MKVGRNKFCAIDRLGSGEVVDGHMDGKGTYWHADSSRHVFFFELSDLIVDRYEGSFCKVSVMATVNTLCGWIVCAGELPHT